MRLVSGPYTFLRMTHREIRITKTQYRRYGGATMQKCHGTMLTYNMTMTGHIFSSFELKTDGSKIQKCLLSKETRCKSVQQKGATRYSCRYCFSSVIREARSFFRVPEFIRLN